MNKTIVKKMLRRNYFTYFLGNMLYKNLMYIKYLGGLSVKNKGCAKLKKDVQGRNNTIVIGEKSVLDHVKIYIRGNNNKIIVGENCTISQKCSFWMEGNDIQIVIGDNSSIQYMTHFCAQEDNVRIVLGNDCMLSNNIIVRTSDSHSILTKTGGDRINPPGNVVLGNHVWVAAQAIILKNVEIGDGAVIGTRSVVTKSIPAHTVAAGMPAKVVKEQIEWDRRRIIVNEKMAQI